MATVPETFLRPSNAARQRRRARNRRLTDHARKKSALVVRCTRWLGR